MNAHRISFDTHLGRLHVDVTEAEVMTTVENIMSCPGPFNLSVEILDTTPVN